MTIYVDSSAFVKSYVDEPEQARAAQLLLSDPVLATSWLSVVEVRRNLRLRLRGSRLASARRRFDLEIDNVALVGTDAETWRTAAEISEVHGVRSLDAVHLASAQGLRIDTLQFLTFDLRQAGAAKALGFDVLGV
jgi:predicted nucleic acid-binding protein